MGGEAPTGSFLLPCSLAHQDGIGSAQPSLQPPGCERQGVGWGMHQLGPAPAPPDGGCLAWSNESPQRGIFVTLQGEPVGNQLRPIPGRCWLGGSGAGPSHCVPPTPPPLLEVRGWGGSGAEPMLAPPLRGGGLGRDFLLALLYLQLKPGVRVACVQQPIRPGLSLCWVHQP